MCVHWLSWAERLWREAELPYRSSLKSAAAAVAVILTYNSQVPAAQGPWLVTVCLITAVAAFLKELQWGSSGSPATPALPMADPVSARTSYSDSLYSLDTNDNLIRKSDLINFKILSWVVLSVSLAV